VKKEINETLNENKKTISKPNITVKKEDKDKTKKTPEKKEIKIPEIKEATISENIRETKSEEVKEIREKETAAIIEEAEKITENEDLLKESSPKNEVHIEHNEAIAKEIDTKQED
jgi:hypothetical protein